MIRLYALWYLKRFENHETKNHIGRIDRNIPHALLYALDVYADEAQRQENGETAIITSSIGVQQGYFLDPLRYSASATSIFQGKPPSC